MKPSPRGIVWIGLVMLLSAMPGPNAEAATYHGGRSGGGGILYGGDSVTFEAGANPAPDGLWIKVVAGQGAAIMTDGAGHVSGADFYLSAGHLLLFTTQPPFTLYFQGAALQVAFGGTVLNRPPSAVCGTGGNGPVMLRTNKLLNVHAETRGGPDPRVDVTAFLSTTPVRSGDLDFYVASDAQALGNASVDTCADPNCCSPVNPSFPIKNLSQGAFTLFQVSTGGDFAIDWDAQVPPVLTCAATASHSSGTAPLAVAFTAEASGGSPGYAWNWSFGDGARSTLRNPTHTYKSGGNFTWRLTVTDAAGITCAKTGQVRVTAALSVTASPNPRQGPEPLTVQFASTPKGGTAPYVFSWDFGDGSTSTLEDPVHTFVQSGAFDCLVTVTDAQARTAIASAPVYVGVPIPPVIESAKILTNPFRLRLAGRDFQTGASVLLDGVPSPGTNFKSAEKLILTGGKDLKALLPKGRSVSILVVNPDGGTSEPFAFTR
ncbi:MAG: PKD domain-containing protein [Acidobacteriota bacterium]